MFYVEQLLSLPLPSWEEAQTPGLLLLRDTMLKVNAQTSLFSKKEVKDGLEGLMLTSLGPWPFLKKLGARHILDVGGGNGLPGLALMAKDPGLTCTVAEVSQKAVATCHHLAKASGLTSARVELNPWGKTFQPVEADAFVSRASALFCSTWNNLLLPDQFVLFGEKSVGPYGYCLERGGIPLAVLKSSVSMDIEEWKEVWHERP